MTDINKRIYFYDYDGNLQKSLKLFQNNFTMVISEIKLPKQSNNKCIIGKDYRNHKSFALKLMFEKINYIIKETNNIVIGGLIVLTGAEKIDVRKNPSPINSEFDIVFLWNGKKIWTCKDYICLLDDLLKE